MKVIVGHRVWEEAGPGLRRCLGRRGRRRVWADGGADPGVWVAALPGDGGAEGSGQSGGAGLCQGGWKGPALRLGWAGGAASGWKRQGVWLVWHWAAALGALGGIAARPFLDNKIQIHCGHAS